MNAEGQSGQRALEGWPGQWHFRRHGRSRFRGDERLVSRGCLGNSPRPGTVLTTASPTAAGLWRNKELRASGPRSPPAAPTSKTTAARIPPVGRANPVPACLGLHARRGTKSAWAGGFTSLPASSPAAGGRGHVTCIRFCHSPRLSPRRPRGRGGRRGAHDHPLVGPRPRRRGAAERTDRRGRDRDRPPR